MGLDVGTLTVTIEARLQEFQRAIKKVNSLVARMGKAVGRGTASIAKSFVNLGKKVAKTAAAFTVAGVAVAAFFAIKFVKDSVAIAAALGLVEARLKTLTGSAEGAARVMEDVRKQVIATPFGLLELGEASANIGVVMRDNAEGAKEFIGIAADLGAVAGIPVQAAAQQIQRVLVNTLGAADLLRDKGISPILRDIAGVGPGADISFAQAIEAFRQLTEEGGIAHNAAVDQANSLAGSLSNTRIEAQNVAIAFGKMIEPAVARFLIGVIQPAFRTLKEIIEDNSAAINDMATKFMPKLLKGLIFAIKVVGFGIRSFGVLSDALGGLSFAWSQLNLLVALGIQGFVRIAAHATLVSDTITLGPLKAIENWNAKMELSNKIQEEARAEAARTNLEIAASSQFWTDAADGVTDFATELAKAATGTPELIKAVERSRAGLTGRELGFGREAVGGKGSGTGPKEDPALAAARKRLAKLEDERRTKLAAQRGELQLQVFELNKVIEQSKADLVLLGKSIADNKALNALIEKRNTLFRAAGEEGVGVRSFTQGIGEAIEGDIGTALTSLAQGDVQMFGNSLADFTSEVLDEGISGVVDSLVADLDNIFGAIGNQVGEILGGGKLGATIGLAFQVGGKFLRDAITGQTKKFSEAAEDLSSSVESVEATRGIIAGPQDIAIAQVGENIADALQGTEFRLDRIIELTEQLVFGGGGSADNVSTLDPLQDSSSLELNTVSQSLV